MAFRLTIDSKGRLGIEIVSEYPGGGTVDMGAPGPPLLPGGPPEEFYETRYGYVDDPMEEIYSEYDRYVPKLRGEAVTTTEVPSVTELQLKEPTLGLPKTAPTLLDGATLQIDPTLGLSDSDSTGVDTDEDAADPESTFELNLDWAWLETSLPEVVSLSTAKTVLDVATKYGSYRVDILLGDSVFGVAGFLRGGATAGVAYGWAVLGVVASAAVGFGAGHFATRLVPPLGTFFGDMAYEMNESIREGRAWRPGPRRPLW